MYGFWLPNDPRGSWSQFVGSWDLYRSGSATKTSERQSVAHQPHNNAHRLAAKQNLKYPPVILTGKQARAVGRGFAQCLASSKYPAHACAILPDHIHLVVGRGKYAVELLIGRLKTSATNALKAKGIHPQAAFVPSGGGRPPKCFSRGAWRVYLDPPGIERAIKYVEQNPSKEGLPPQRWSFVTTRA